MLRQIAFDPEFPPLPAHVVPLATAARARAAVMRDPANPARIGGFEMTDPRIGWGIVTSLRAHPNPRDNSFCEWGAGIGLITCLADLAGWCARGIELEPALVAEGRAMARELRIDVNLSVGSYKPAGFLDRPALDSDLPAARGLFDGAVTYVYGWPAELDGVLRFFGRGAPPGALLLLYRGGLNMSLWRQDGVSSCNSAARPLR